MHFRRVLIWLAVAIVVVGAVVAVAQLPIRNDRIRGGSRLPPKGDVDSEPANMTPVSIPPRDPTSELHRPGKEAIKPELATLTPSHVLIQRDDLTNSTRYIDQDLGVDISFPSADQTAVIEKQENEDGSVFLDVNLKTHDGQMMSYYAVVLIPNTDGLTLTEWFRADQDPEGEILASPESFSRETLSNGVEMIFIDSLPEGYDWGPIGGTFFALSPSGKMIIAVYRGNDTDLQEFGYSYDEQEDLIRNLLATMKVP